MQICILFSGSVQQEVGFRLSQGNYHYGHALCIFDNDNFSRGWPSQRSARMEDCTRELGPGGREGDLATMSQTSTSLFTNNSFSSSSKVSLYFTHIFYALVLTDLLRFACCQNLLCQDCQEAYQQGKRLERVHSEQEGSAACQEGGEQSGFRGNELKKH